MVPHLSKCVLVAPDIRNRAVAEINDKKNRCELENPPNWANPPMLGRSVSTPLPTIMTASGYPNSGSSASPFGSPIPSPLLLSAPLLNIDRPLKRARSMSSFSNSDSSPSLTGRVWNSSLQQEFGDDFCKLLIATRSSWNTAHNPQVQLFFEKWVPGAIVPDRRTLSGTILDREAAKVEEKLKLKLKGRKATFQTDGWKNKAKQAIIATMVSVDFEVSGSNSYINSVLLILIKLLTYIAVSNANSRCFCTGKDW